MSELGSPLVPKTTDPDQTLQADASYTLTS